MTDQQATEATNAAVAAGVKPEQYMRAYWAANPPSQPEDESKMTVRLYAYGTTTAEYDRLEWQHHVEEDMLDHLIDHDASDLETDTLIVDGDGAFVDPY
jgi:hypothetical protein